MKRQVSCTVCFYPIISIPLFVHIFLSCFRFCSCNLHKNFVNLAANQNALPSMQTWNDAMQTMQLTSPKKEERMLQWKSHFWDYNFSLHSVNFVHFFVGQFGYVISNVCFTKSLPQQNSPTVWEWAKKVKHNPNIGIKNGRWTTTKRRMKHCIVAATQQIIWIVFINI